MRCIPEWTVPIVAKLLLASTIRSIIGIARCWYEVGNICL
jgi:hypothetical protein